MKTEFKAKFLQHVAKKRKEEGFTLIELLVVIIIIGILSAIALPSFLNQANKAKQSEAKQYISSINKGQQAYYAENTGFVATDISALNLGIKTQTSNYIYALDATLTDGALASAGPINLALQGYWGGVGLIGEDGAKTTTSIICGGKGASVKNPPTNKPKLNAAKTDLECGADTDPITK